MIRVEQFHKHYEGTQAVSGLSFSVESGQILGLIGPNGAGKTTTMRGLAGIIPLSHGQMTVGGFDVEQQGLETRKRLAYIPDDPQLFQDLTVEQHLAFTASAFHVLEADQKAKRLLQRFELTDRRRTRAGELSRGMRQKLAICCAYLRDPEALLFDEPLTGLDPHGIRTLKTSIIERAAAGAAVVISSHLLAMVEDICTHVLILDHGRDRYHGAIGEFRQRFGGEHGAISLEEIFFLATSGAGESRGQASASGARPTEGTQMPSDVRRKAQPVDSQEVGV